MLPFTTYQLPESELNQTPGQGRWLVMFVPRPVSDTARDLLTKISAALKADFDQQVWLAELESGQPVAISEVKDIRPELVIAFGIPPADLGLWIDLEQHGIRQLEAFTFIYTLHPDKLADHAGAKKELWRHLQFFLETKAAHAR